MSYLTTSLEDLQDLVIADLEGEGFAYNPRRTTWPQYLAICLGEPSAYLVKSVPKMLAELDAQYGGSLSNLRASEAQLMDDLQANIGADGGEELPAPPEGFKYLVNADGAYLLNADGAYLLVADEE